MKHLFTTIALAAMTSVSAFAVDFNDAVTDPAQGTVESLSEINITFPNVYDLDFVSKAGIYMVFNDQVPVRVTPSYYANTLTVELAEEATTAGEYVLVIEEGSIVGYSDDYMDELDNPDKLTYTWTIAGEENPDAFDFSNPVLTPALGTVESLSTITVTFPNIFDLDINDSEAIFILYQDSEIEGTSKVKGNTLTFTLKEEATGAGEYILFIGAGALCGYNEDYDPLDNPSEMYFSYIINGSGQTAGLNFDYTVSPQEGDVEELSEIVLRFPNSSSLGLGSGIYDKIKATHDGVAIEGFKIKEGDTSITFSFTEAQTEAGTYNITINPGAVTIFAKDGSWLDLDKTITLTWTIGAAEETLDFSFSAQPANGSALPAIEMVNITFDALNYAEPKSAPVIMVGEEELAADAFTFGPNDDAAGVVITFEPALTAEVETLVKITFAEESIEGTAGETTSLNANPIVLNYTILPAVTESLTLELTGATKPNEEGEISAEKQLTAFFFIAPEAGLEPKAGEEHNVTITEDEGDFTASAHLSKGYGFDSTRSYFSAPFNTEPRNNGGYTIVIEAGAFGDAAWIANPEVGHTNPEIELHFTLIDGISTGIDSIKVNGEDVEIFDINGRKVNGNLLPGLYIVNGRKMVVK